MSPAVTSAIAIEPGFLETLLPVREYDSAQQDFAQAVLAGLSRKQKTLPCKYFYDRIGSQLFEQICELPEYYVTRTEKKLLADVAAGIGRLCGEAVQVVEFGSGAGEKIRLLLNALVRPAGYVPIDISREILQRSAVQLQQEFPSLAVTPCCIDYSCDSDWQKLPPAQEMRRLIFFPGSTIGNFTPQDAKAFLKRLACLAGSQGHVLIGVDLQKELNVLLPAYNDAAGVTAAFNLNLLRRIRRELGVDVPLEHFFHQASYNTQRHRIEMHLVCRRSHEWQVAGKRISFRSGETIHTENSYKYTVEGFKRLAVQAGLAPVQAWTDENHWFSIHLLRTA